MHSSQDIAVLVVAFKRPYELQQCLERLFSIGVRRVFLSVDGPRNRDEGVRVNEVRSLAEAFSDRLQITSRFAAENNGCRAWVSSSISWFFQSVLFGIIVEEDILLDERFYLWCKNISDRSGCSERVMHVNAFFPQSAGLPAQAAHFTKYPTSWGWATWREEWAKYDDQMVGFSDRGYLFQLTSLSRSMGCGWRVALHYTLALRMAHQGKLSSWAYRWALTVWRHGGLALSPGINLSRNIGGGPEATHTGDEGLDRYLFASADDQVSVEVDQWDQSRDQRIFSAVARTNSFWRMARMAASVFVPNPLFFVIRRKLRS